MAITIIKGDITEQRVDAIVNAANEQLLPGAGVCGAIHKKGGDEIFFECAELIERMGHPCWTGTSVLTCGGNLPAPYVIHAVGPRWAEPRSDRLLRSAYGSAFVQAWQFGLDTIAFPSISTGIYGYPIDLAARIAVAEAKRWRREFKEIRFVLFDDETYRVFREVGSPWWKRSLVDVRVSAV
jgi:O-acetyl-ADP-ribose deacetylase (regulator of RNase III)